MPEVWQRSSFCSGGNCVEVAEAGGKILMRNSTEPDRQLVFTEAEWAAFIAGVGDSGGRS